MLIVESLWDRPRRFSSLPDTVVTEVAGRAFWHSFRLLPVQLAALGMLALPVAGAHLAMAATLGGSDGTLGAATGFVVGQLWLQRQVRRQGQNRFGELRQVAATEAEAEMPH